MKRCLLVGVAVGLLLLPAPARAQLSDPCGVTCGATLLGVGAVVATGAVVSVADQVGGLSTESQGLWIWSTTFALTVGGGIALSGDGWRQEHAIRSAAVGAAAGAAIGLVLAAASGQNNRASELATTLISAGIGAVFGGVYGALTAPGEPVPVVLLSF